jgi:hypothetical protein
MRWAARRFASCASQNTRSPQLQGADNCADYKLLRTRIYQCSVSLTNVQRLYQCSASSSNDVRAQRHFVRSPRIGFTRVEGNANPPRGGDAKPPVLVDLKILETAGLPGTQSR